MNRREHMTLQEQEPLLVQHEGSSKGKSGIKDTLERWIQPPTFLLSIVIIAELYIIIAYRITDITLLITLLITAAIFAGIRIKDIITMIATMKGLSHHERIERDKDSPP
jgi:hypothetical protein